MPLPLPRRLLPFVLLLLGLLSLALVWQFSPARQWLQPLALLEAARQIGWLTQLAVFVLAGCTAVPLSLLVLLAALVQGPWLGAGTSLLGGALIGSLTFALGTLLGRQAVAQWAGPKLQAVNALVARRGLLAVVLVRLVPAAPFAVVNLLLGATPLRWGAFLLGNSLGMLPMVSFTVLLAPRILAQLQQPSALGWWSLAVVVALVLAAGYALRRWAARA